MGVKVLGVMGEVHSLSDSGMIIKLCFNDQMLILGIDFSDISNMDNLAYCGKKISDKKDLIGKRVSFLNGILELIPPDRK